MTIKNTIPEEMIASQVALALQEDVGQLDLTADLIPIKTQAIATIITREKAILSGQAWCNQVFQQLDPNITIEWFFSDGDRLDENDVLCKLTGSARTLLTGERTAMNFIQTLSATATHVNAYVEEISGLATDILDTRKTIPGLRLAQKYAVLCGGGVNHRIGLYDGILIKENHINAAGSIAAAVEHARQYHAGIDIEVEVENFTELKQALAAQADIILLDNFEPDDLIKAVELNQKQAKLEASGGINLNTVRAIAETGVDRISIGALTKDIKAVDLSMRFL
ncbi:MAG: nicotinate-nucleotide diphosphorylase (carboxylating) [Gammaproteobacteria bacterium]|nr:MAG: nicotinate-nucleotide diphosphorylase (carboxylating) [Gammaproteobacteria bacterium]